MIAEHYRLLQLKQITSSATDHYILFSDEWKVDNLDEHEACSRTLDVLAFNNKMYTTVSKLRNALNESNEESFQHSERQLRNVSLHLVGKKVKND